jgi:hypothetical protein
MWQGLAMAEQENGSGVAWVQRFAAELGVEPPDESTVETLLDLAAVAARASERLAAPLACYLVGLAGAEPAAALDRARRLAGAD